MQVHVHHDGTIKGSERLTEMTTASVEAALSRFREITTVEVHYADENGAKSGGDDIRCTIEVRFAGMKPIAITQHSDDLLVALDSASEKIAGMLDKQLAKLRENVPVS